MRGTPRGAKISNIRNERLIGNRQFLTSLPNSEIISKYIKAKTQ
jgi:hypothetical protein